MPDAARPLRLAFIANPTSILVQRWVSFFARRGHQVTLLDGFGSPASAGLDDAVRVIRYDARGPIRLPLAPTINAWFRLRRILGDLRPDVVHAHSVKRYGWQAGIAACHPYVISTWGSDVLLPPDGWQARFWNRRTLGRADLVTAVSQFMRDAAIDAGARAKRVVIVQFGVDVARFSPAPVTGETLRELGLDGRSFVFSPRAMKPIYNHETILAAFGRLGDVAQLVMTGRNADAAHRELLVRRMEELGISERVLVIDDIPDDAMLALYRAAAVVVSAPLSDSFPITLLEAMACGTPIVAGDLPPVRAGLADLAPDAIVPTTDVTAMADALRRAVEMPPAERRTLGELLRRRAVASADYETNMLRMERLYRELVSGRR
ncbi:MAG TPA: glycosyltransferase [Candidatus Limnocylindria bacterium]|nr:glycosyltransferase [Candidatus Limnocylindria bacterium]